MFERRTALMRMPSISIPGPQTHGRALRFRPGPDGTQPDSASAPCAAAGSSRLQCRPVTAKGKMGQASLAFSQTLITYWRRWLQNSATSFDRCVEMSMTRSFITLMVSGLSCVGWAAALAASKRSPAKWRRNPSAIWLRREFAVHPNKTRGVFINFFFQLLSSQSV